MFFLGGLVAYLHYHPRKKGARFLWFSFALFILALLAKSMAVSFPLVLVLCDFLFRRKPDRQAILEKVPFFCVSAIFVWVGYVAQVSSRSFKVDAHFSVFDNMLITAGGLVFYLVKTVLPVGLSAFYPFPEKAAGTMPAMSLAAPVVVVLLAAGIWVSRKVTRKVVFGAGFFFLTLLPALVFVPLGRQAFAADRYTYLPAIGLCYLAGEGFTFLQARGASVKFLRPVLWAALLCSAAVLSILTWNRSLVWRDSFTLWNDVIARYPSTAVAYNNRGTAWTEVGDYTRALADHGRSIELDPANTMYLLNYADRLYDLRRLEEAVSVYRRALSLGPNHYIYNNLGLALAGLGKMQEAMQNYRLSLRIKPDNPTALVNLGVALAEEDRPDEAIAQYREALRIDPYSADAHFNLAVDLESMGKLEEAAEHFRRVLIISPGHAQATANLERVLARLRR